MPLRTATHMGQKRRQQLRGAEVSLEDGELGSDDGCSCCDKIEAAVVRRLPVLGVALVVALVGCSDADTFEEPSSSSITSSADSTESSSGDTLPSEIVPQPAGDVPGSPDDGTGFIVPSDEVPDEAPVRVVYAATPGLVRSIVVDGSGRLWMASELGAVWMDTESGELLMFEASQANDAFRGFGGVSVGPDGDVWFEGSDLVVHFDGNWASYPVSGFFEYGGGGVVVAASDGSVWYSGGEGVSRFADGSFEADDGWSDLGGIVAESSDGLMWAQTVDGGVARWDGDWSRYSETDAGGNPMYGSPGSVGLYQAGQGPPTTRDGAWWFGSWEGVLRLDGDTWSTVTAGGEGPWSCFAIAVDAGDRVWAGCESELYRYAPSSHVLEPQEWWWEATDGLANRDVEFLYPIPDGRIWAGVDLTDGGGVMLFDEFDQTTYWSDALSLGYPVSVDARGNLWLVGQQWLVDQEASLVTITRISPASEIDTFEITPDSHQ